MTDNYQEVPMPRPVIRPRWVLRIQARFWRLLMGIGMFLHKLASPRPPSPAFTRTIATTVSEFQSSIVLHFYVPDDYKTQTRLQTGKKFPVVINFHGGGFTLGTGTDDCRWAAAVTEQLGAVVVSVDYRLSPEWPFPTGIEDGVDAIKYLVANADVFSLDVDRFALSGFSAGANLCYTISMMLQDVSISPASTPAYNGSPSTSAISLPLKSSSSPTRLNPRAHHDPFSSSSSSPAPNQKARVRERSALQPFRLRSLITFYPPVDSTLTRAERRASCPVQEHHLPPVFTDLFDQAYFFPRDLDLSQPYISPAHASTATLDRALPNDIVIFTCEWDMLQAEGARFAKRLRDEVGKNVYWEMVKAVPHGWDKAPNARHPPEKAAEAYATACGELKRSFGMA